MDAFEKAMGSVTVKAAMTMKVGDNHTRSGTLIKPPAEFTVDAYAKAAADGVKLAEKLTNDDKSRSITRSTKDAVTGPVGVSAACYLLGYTPPTPKEDKVPDAVKNRGKGVPSNNATAPADGAAAK